MGSPNSAQCYQWRKEIAFRIHLFQKNASPITERSYLIKEANLGARLAKRLHSYTIYMMLMMLLT